ncbi:hypothetical protein SteCoe_11311 [Stentor coeruleus]|uniref:Transmembrane protein n=1 Tax=Stentor coeruleus TaxID=5963 RepID=A0A1R2CDG3_9CILI|nr:hypothetical protein SteCoe_11311 [Stentor coeruleus]
MYLNKFLRPATLTSYTVTAKIEQKLALKLVEFDNSFKPSKDFPEALKAYDQKSLIDKSEWNQAFILFRFYMGPFIVLSGVVIYSYLMLKQRKENLLDFTESDYKRLTLRQLQKKEKMVQQSKQFDSVLNALQDKLKDDYQVQLHEFQDFVEDMQANNKS